MPHSQIKPTPDATFSPGKRYRGLVGGLIFASIGMIIASYIAVTSGVLLFPYVLLDPVLGPRAVISALVALGFLIIAAICAVWLGMATSRDARNVNR